MHLITPKYVYPQKVICTPNAKPKGYINVSGNAGISAFASINEMEVKLM